MCDNKKPTGGTGGEDARIDELLMDTARLMRQRARMRMESIGLMHGQGKILGIIRHHSDICQADLAERLNIKPPTVSVTLNRMVKNGWVERAPDPRDQRRIIVRLTEKGIGQLDAIDANFDAIEDELLNGLAETELEALRSILPKMRKNLIDAAGGDNIYGDMPPHGRGYHKKRNGDDGT